MKKLWILAAVVVLTTGCAVDKAMQDILGSSAMPISFAEGDGSVKYVGDLKIGLDIVNKEPNPSYANADTGVWRFVIQNNCSIVYRNEGMKLGAWVGEDPIKLDWRIDFSGMELVPGQGQDATFAFIDAETMRRSWKRTIKIGLYGLPVCKGDKYIGRENVEWNMVYKKPE